MKKYSLVFLFPDEIAGFIRDMKHRLKREARWYHSCHSEPHMTICEFEALPGELTVYLQEIRSFSEKQRPFWVHLDSTDTFPGTYYVKPDAYSRQKLERCATALVADVFGLELKGWKAHATVGRRLTAEQFAIAIGLFARLCIDFRFLCNSVCLREFDPSIQQYRVIQLFTFTGPGEPDSPVIQLNLFS